MSKEPSLVRAGTRCEVSMRNCACACCKVRSCWSGAWCRTAVSTAACSARKGVIRRGYLTGRDDRKSDRFAADEREAGESPDAYLRQGEPQLPAVRAFSRACDRGQRNAPFGSLYPVERSKFQFPQCFQGFPPTLYRPHAPILIQFTPNLHFKTQKKN